ncbi:glutathione S-transferase family protein [Polynucleobacter bastaniensis]|jgi:glutathione S-transferase|uniref:glutathione S-transferase family protein n=1 Tax=Polynucleobacter bastaniensis TaxID=2081039 RepID=UPI001C0CDDFE|nr:glutathione S-transferase N-terminal domain-containing protein [Polynucleobacter bastaniensis]MBU3596904.1 glutathione S-transferase N-terminal domain-containing protein [Polynucleobacter bastaniensis]
MMRLWGRKSSINVQKVLWCFAELGLEEGKDFERIDAGLHFGKNRTPEFLALNPNGLVPTLEDGNLVLWESNTILRYLRSQYDPTNHFPADIAAQYQSEKWMDWQVGTMWPALRIAFLGLTRTPENERNKEAIRKAYQDSNALFSLLDQQLANQHYCSGGAFNIGDIPLALCVSRWILLNQNFPDQTGPRPSLHNIDAWMQRIETGTKYSVVAEKELNIVK